MDDVMIETDRLILRKINKDDYLEIANILQDIEVMYAWKKSFSDDEVKLWIRENLKRYDDEGYSYFLAVNKEDGTVVGVMGPLAEKIKWGGVRLNNVEYILFDLEQFRNIVITKPNDEDIKILNNIFNCIGNCRENDGPRQLEKYLKEVLPSSKGERDVLIEIFADIGILEPKKERQTRGRDTDFGYIEDWRGEDGYNMNIAKELFKAYF